MKKSAIKEIFYGIAREARLMTPEYKKLLDEVVKNDDEIRERLASHPELLTLYTKTNDSIEAMHCEVIEDEFVEGFKFGLQVGIECSED